MPQGAHWLCARQPRCGYDTAEGGRRFCIYYTMWSRKNANDFLQAARSFALFFPARQQPCNGRAMHLHGALGAKFLAAEAANALVPVNLRAALHHCNGLGRADARAFPAAHALVRMQLGPRCKCFGDKLRAEPAERAFGVAPELQTVRLIHQLKIRDSELRPVARHREL